MLTTIREFFIQRLGNKPDRDPGQMESRLRIATAALMFEIGLADSRLQPEERKQIEEVMRSTFQLGADECRELLAVAENEIDKAVSLHEFTRLLNVKLSRRERVRIIELLWQVACADNVIDKYEEYYIRKIADLLYITHAEYIQAKHRATAQAGASPG